MRQLLILWLISFSTHLVAQNIEDLEKWCGSKNAGAAYDCFRLAEYHYWDGGGQKFKAPEFYQKACSGVGFGGVPRACVSLGNMYLKGDVVRLDKPKALDLFYKACYGVKNALVPVGCNEYDMLKNSNVK
jgi:hypothetical protein